MVEDATSTAPDFSGLNPMRFISGMVNVPVVTVLAIDEPEIMPVIIELSTDASAGGNDLVQVFLTGVNNFNNFENGTPGEMLRLNTSIPAALPNAQNPLGVIAGDNAGFPNGRRPGDDVVDVALRAAMGVLLDPTSAPSGGLAFTDGVRRDATDFDAAFPFLRSPQPGSPN